jgi:hypothetical protein
LVSSQSVFIQLDIRLQGLCPYAIILCF